MKYQIGSSFEFI